MYVLITGAAGFIGQLVAEALLNDEQYKVLLSDVVAPPIPKGVKYPHNAKTVQVDLCASPEKVAEKSLDAAFIFHGIMSAGSEANFELGMRVNLDATRSVLDALRANCPGVRVIYASSQAVYGQPLPAVVDESVVPTPQSSYGAEKIVGETLVNEYTRRKFIDGFTLRFPTISVRPGKPTAAASSWISGMVREPLKGEECVIPLEDRSFRSWVCSPKTLVGNLIHSLTVPSSSLPPHVRQVNAPGISVTVQEMLDAVERVGGKEALSHIKEQRIPEMEEILRSWPVQFDNALAYKLGYKADASFDQAVVDYKASLG